MIANSVVAESKGFHGEAYRKDGKIVIEIDRLPAELKEKDLEMFAGIMAEVYFHNLHQYLPAQNPDRQESSFVSIEEYLTADDYDMRG